MRSAGLLLLLCVTLAVAAYLAAVWGVQRRVLYPRPPAPSTPPLLPDGTTAAWLGPDNGVEAWLMRPSRERWPFPIVVFAHGNGELIDHWLPPFEVMTKMGVGVLLVEYPGYGRSSGSPTQSSITEAMTAAYDFAASQPGVDPARIVAYGRSLGGGAACALARERPIAALILESSFTSVRDMARRFGLPGPFVLDPFENLETVSDLDVPVLVLHGQHDSLIPVSHGEALAAAAGVELVRMSCGHNDCPRPFRQIRTFFEANGILDRQRGQATDAERTRG